MKRNRIRRFFLQKQYAIVSFLFFVAIAGMTGVYLSNRITEENRESELAQKETALAEKDAGTKEHQDRFSQNLDSILKDEKSVPEEKDTASVTSVIRPKETEPKTVNENTQDTGQNNDGQKKAESTAQPKDVVSQAGEQVVLPKNPEPKQDTATHAKAAATLHFSSDMGLSWPMQGDVILNYSMDQTVYFATLDQYKYNPALIIAGKVNEPVSAAATGKITDISTNEETGVTVTMDLGDGYSAVYGQMKEVLYKEGATVEAGNAIGYVAQPTKYYSVEGSNLYFKLLKDGEPVDPMQYMAG